MELRENSGDQGKRGSDPRHQRLVWVNMVKLTMLARVADGLPLAEGLDSDRQQDLEQYKQQAKTLFKKLSQGPPPPSRMSYESGAFFLHYLIEGGVCYLTLCDRGYPKKLAYQYLEDLQREFSTQNGAQVETVARPYAFIKFDTFIQRTKKLYLDTRTQRNLNKLNEDLHDIQRVMTRNIQDILGQGERLDHVSNMSETLANETRKYSSKAKELSRQALIQKYLPLVVVVGFVLLMLFFRYYVFAKKKKLLL